MCLFFPPLEGGNAVRFSFFVFFVVGTVSFAFLHSSFLRVAVRNKFSGANFCFWVSVLVLCFSVVFCLGFSFMIWRFAPETVWKNSLDVRSCFFGFALSSLGFFVDVVSVCFLFKRQRSGSNRTPHTHWFGLFFLSRRVCFIALFGRASCFLVFSRGAILGPARFLDSPGTYGA